MMIYQWYNNISVAATGGGHVPTLKSTGTSYVLVPPTFTTTFILIGWSNLYTKSFQRPYIPYKRYNKGIFVI